MPEKNVYLDYAATAPTRKEVVDTMLPFFTREFGNPSSVHSFGEEAKIRVEEARKEVADFLNASPEEIIFTSGGTESDNTSLIGAAFKRENEGKHIITSSIEHHAVLESAHFLEKRGFEVTYIPVDEKGLVDPEDVKKALKKETILVSIMHANNEVGTVQPIEEIAKIVKENSNAYFHTDAVQSAGYLDIDVKDIGIDLLSISGHKLYGPKGVGVLYLGGDVELASFMHGGGQEEGRRAGTHNVPGIVGMSKAFEILKIEKETEAGKIKRLRDYLIKEILDNFDFAILTGHPEKRLPNNASFIFKGIEGESLVLALDRLGIYASSGSACASGSDEPSHVITALGYEPDVAQCSIRFSLGKDTTEQDIKYTLSSLKKVVPRLKEISPIS